MDISVFLPPPAYIEIEREEEWEIYEKQRSPFYIQQAKIN